MVYLYLRGEKGMVNIEGEGGGSVYEGNKGMVCIGGGEWSAS